jgi:hypothetical protein
MVGPPRTFITVIIIADTPIQKLKECHVQTVTLAAIKCTGKTSLVIQKENQYKTPMKQNDLAT